MSLNPSAIAGAVHVPLLRRGAFPRCGGSYLSASTAVTQTAAEELGPLGGGPSILSQRWVAAALRRRSGFPQLCGTASALPVGAGSSGG